MPWRRGMDSSGRGRRPRRCIAKWRSAGALLAKPLTFMNLSGYAVGDLLRYYKVDLADLLVIVDEAQLELGRLRTRGGGLAGGHNGLKSLIEQLGTDEFARLRFGVGRGDARRDLADHVLAVFDKDEQPVVVRGDRPGSRCRRSVRQRRPRADDEQVQPAGRQGRRRVSRRQKTAQSVFSLLPTASSFQPPASSVLCAGSWKLVAAKAAVSP